MFGTLNALADKIRSGRDAISRPKPLPSFILKDILPIGGRACLFGDAKMGKSYFALDLALHIALGEDYLGMQIPRPFNVLYFNFELDEGMFDQRIAEVLGGIPAPENFGYVSLQGHDIPMLDTKEGKAIIDSYPTIQQSKGFETQVVILDCRWRTFAGDDSQTQPMIAWTKNVDEFYAKPAALVIHHKGKKTTGVGAGSSCFDRWVNSWLQLEPHHWTDLNTPSIERKLLIRGNYGEDRILHLDFVKPYFKLCANPELWQSAQRQVDIAIDFIHDYLADNGEAPEKDLVKAAMSAGIKKWAITKAIGYLKQRRTLVTEVDTGRQGHYKMLKVATEVA